LSPVIKLELTDEEYEKVLLDAFDSNCPSVREYMRLLFFDEAPSYDYEDLLWQVNVGIGDLKSGDSFIVRDLITQKDWNDIPLNARKNLGRMVMQSVLNGKDFQNIAPDGKDSQGVQRYKKK